MIEVKVWRSLEKYMNDHACDKHYEVEAIEESVCGSILLVGEFSNIMLPPQVVLEIIEEEYYDTQ